MAESRPGVPLIATKGLRYGTRRLLAEDDFTANKRDARLLVAIGKARYRTEAARVLTEGPVRKGGLNRAESFPTERPPAPGPIRPAPAADERPALRSEYAKKTGKKPFGGWDAVTLREKIAAAKSEG